MADENNIPNEGHKKRMSRLTCSQCEGMLLDAADGLLLTEDETHFRLHLADCQACTKLFGDVQRGSAWMEMLKAEPPTPPSDLVNKILSKTSGDAAVVHEVMANVAYSQSLFGHQAGGAKVLPFRAPAPRTPWARMVHTVMQPRFAMTAAMAFFSIALTMNLAGVHLSDLHATDLSPKSVKKSFWSMNGRVVQYYDNLRVVYELESRVKEMQRDSDEDRTPQRGVTTPQQPEEQQPSRQPSGQPHSSAPHFHGGQPSGPSQSERPHFHLLPVEQPNHKSVAGIERGEGVQA